MRILECIFGNDSAIREQDEKLSMIRKAKTS